MTNDTTSDDGHHNAPSKFKWLITYLSDCQRYFQVESSDLADTMTEVKEHRELNKPPILPPWDKGNTPPWGDGYNTVGTKHTEKVNVVRPLLYYDSPFRFEVHQGLCYMLSVTTYFLRSPCCVTRVTTLPISGTTTNPLPQILSP